MSEQAFYDVAQTVLDCVCEQLGDDCPCRAFVSAGEPEIDCCMESGCDGTGGMLAVHVEQIFPSDNFPIPTAGFDPCKAQTWVALVVVTIARCAPTMDEQGSPASPEDRSASALRMALDQHAVVTALSCCVPAQGVVHKRRRRVQIDESRSRIDEGGCASFEVRAFVDAGMVCDCAEGS